MEEEDSDDGRQRGRTRGRPPRAADDTKMPSASFSSTRSYLRRSRRKNGNRIPLPRTGKREVSERASERASERTNERASERNGERANERTSEEGRTEGASESEATRQRQRHGSPCRVSSVGCRGSRSGPRPTHTVHVQIASEIPEVSARRRRPPGSAISIMPLFPGLHMHAPRFLLALAPISAHFSTTCFTPASLLSVLRYPFVPRNPAPPWNGRIWNCAKKGDLKPSVSSEKGKKGDLNARCNIVLQFDVVGDGLF